MAHDKQERILEFWFGDDSLHEVDNMDRWFTRNTNFDREIESLFADEMKAAGEGAFDDWAKTPRGALALILLIDQFPRNVYRDDARAFAQDERARRVAEMAIDRGLDQKLNPIERCFMYLPLEHSEDPIAQNRSVGLFTELLEVASTEEKEALTEALQYAIRHKEIIERFGRFPHRNEVLGRDSTKEETAFLKTPNSSF